MTIRQGDLVRHVQPGGGGHGDPLARDLALIERDLADGKIGRDYAESRHGAIVDPVTLAIDRPASERRRCELGRAGRATPEAAGFGHTKKPRQGSPT